MGSFSWPWQYNFPPFFTLQINQETKRQQLRAWRFLVLDYTKTMKQCTIDIREAQRSPLFCNSNINRRLSQEGILSVMEELNRTGNAEPTDKTKTRWHIYWEPLEEIGSAIYKWASASGMVGTVCTLFELSEGDMTTNEIFHGLENEVLLKALHKLELQKKAEIINMEDSQGVKFF